MTERLDAGRIRGHGDLGVALLSKMGVAVGSFQVSLLGYVSLRHTKVRLCAGMS